jgi:hypothetical protein
VNVSFVAGVSTAAPTGYYYTTPHIQQQQQMRTMSRPGAESAPYIYGYPQNNQHYTQQIGAQQFLGAVPVCS